MGKGEREKEERRREFGMYILRSCGQVLRYGHEIIKPIPSRLLFSREIQAGVQ